MNKSNNVFVRTVGTVVVTVAMLAGSTSASAGWDLSVKWTMVCKHRGVEVVRVSGISAELAGVKQRFYRAAPYNYSCYMFQE